MVEKMPSGSVIVDLAAERGGNCELTESGETVVKHDVTIIGTTNLPASVPYHASQMYAKNVVTLLDHLIVEGQLKFDLADEITRETLVCHDGKIVQPRVCEILGIELSPPQESAKE
jgi:NAD(P) transhydrogenase subunit alpha